MLALPALKYADFSHNHLTSAGFKRFNTAYVTLREVDLSSNRIAQDVSELFWSIPPTLENCDFSNNNIKGSFPEEFPLKQVVFFSMAHNRISGPLPDFPNTASKLKTLDLEDNLLTGTIQGDYFKLDNLSLLNLAGNHLSGSIPSSIGDLTQLSTLKLSSNRLDQDIPVKLAKLKGRCYIFIAPCLRAISPKQILTALSYTSASGVSEIFDLSSNTLTGTIPLELGEFKGDVQLIGNPNL